MTRDHYYHNLPLLSFPQLIYFDQKTYKLPDAILNLYSDRVRHLDLSYNKLSSFESLELFTNLEELVLDNNYLTDEIIFPAQLNQVKLLSLNNNKVSAYFMHFVAG